MPDGKNGEGVLVTVFGETAEEVGVGIVHRRGYTPAGMADLTRIRPTGGGSRLLAVEAGGIIRPAVGTSTASSSILLADAIEPAGRAQIQAFAFRDRSGPGRFAHAVDRLGFEH